MIYLKKFAKIIFYIFIIAISSPLFFRFSFFISPYKEISSDKIQTSWIPVILKDNDNGHLKIDDYRYYISEIKKDKFSLYIPENNKYQCEYSKINGGFYEFCYKSIIKNENIFSVYLKHNNGLSYSIYTISKNKIIYAKTKRENGFALFTFITITLIFWISFFKYKKYIKIRLQNKKLQPDY